MIVNMLTRTALLYDDVMVFYSAIRLFLIMLIRIFATQSLENIYVQKNIYLQARVPKNVKTYNSKSNRIKHEHARDEKIKRWSAKFRKITLLFVLKSISMHCAKLPLSRSFFRPEARRRND